MEPNRKQDDDQQQGGASPAAELPVASEVAAPVASDVQPNETTHSDLMRTLGDEARTGALVAKLTYTARTKYGLRSIDAQDVFHESVTTYLAIHSRYDGNENHFGILVGIFHRKALEFINARQRRERVADRYLARVRAIRPKLVAGQDPEGDAAERVIRAEDAQLIRSAIDSLSPEARELLLELADGRTTRMEMIERLGINRNTFDTRLRTLRLRLRDALTAIGVV